MLEISGEYNSAIIYNDNVEQSALSQIYALLNNEVSIGSKIRIMPDVHAGAGCVIGYTATLTNKIIVNLIGVDIGCGITSICIGKKDIDFQKLDDIIHIYVPSGHNVHTSQSGGEWIQKDFTDGHRGEAHAKKSAKKYVHSRMRVKQKNFIVSMLKEV
jgi:RNA-splicing ligase RtcB